MDRTFKGLIAGAVGAIPMNIINLFLYHLGLVKLRFIDWASIIVTGNLPRDTNDLVYSLFIQILWSGSLGILLAYLIFLVSSKGFLFKGLIYAFLAGFVFRGIVVLFQVPELWRVPTLTSELNFLSTSTWGLTTALMLRKLDSHGS